MKRGGWCLACDWDCRKCENKVTVVQFNLMEEAKTDSSLEVREDDKGLEEYFNDRGDINVEEIALYNIEQLCSIDTSEHDVVELLGLIEY